MWLNLGVDPENSERGGHVPHPTPLRIKTLHFGTCSIQHCERIRDAKYSNVNVSEDRIKDHFIKWFSKQNNCIGSGETFRKYKKKGGPQPPPLNLPMKFSLFQALGQWGRSESSAGWGDEQGLVEEEGALSLPDPALRFVPRCFPIFPTDWEPGTG